jgi:hypothetical protein
MRQTLSLGDHCLVLILIIVVDHQCRTSGIEEHTRLIDGDLESLKRATGPVSIL